MLFSKVSYNKQSSVFFVRYDIFAKITYMISVAMTSAAAAVLVPIHIILKPVLFGKIFMVLRQPQKYIDMMDCIQLLK